MNAKIIAGDGATASPTNTNSKVHCGVYFYPYVLDLFRRREVTFRGALLLAVVDHTINPWRQQRRFDIWERRGLALGEMIEQPAADVTCAFTTTSNLCRVLQCSDETARQTIKELCAVRPCVFQARRTKQRWQVRTRTRQETQTENYVFVPAKILDLWLEGRLGGKRGWSVLMLGIIDGFKRSGKKCYMSNSVLGKRCGVGERAARDMVYYLLREKLLNATYTTTKNVTTRYLEVPNEFSPKLKELIVGDDDFSDLWDDP